MKQHKAIIDLETGGLSITKSNTLESVCEYFGVVNPDSHRALGDCYATLEVYKKLKL